MADLWLIYGFMANLPSGKLTLLWFKFTLALFNGKIKYKRAMFNDYAKLLEGMADSWVEHSINMDHGAG